MKLVFREKRAQAAGVQSFRFTPIEPLTWIAGQSIKLELPAGYATEERRFTISSAPYEGDILIATKISGSRFKQALDALEPGASVTAYSIDGTFTWSEITRRRVLCASGVGITPYYSMLKQRAHDNQPLDAVLLYAGRTSGFLFGDEIQELARTHPELTVILLPEQRLSAATVAKHVSGLAECLVYISGPSAMVDELALALLEKGVPESQLKRDWFTGRAGWEASGV